MISVETIPGMGGEGIKENGRGGEFKYVYLIFCKTFLNVTMFPYPAQQLKKKEDIMKSTSYYTIKNFQEKKQKNTPQKIVHLKKYIED
jgi:hypothetical protein